MMQVRPFDIMRDYNLVESWRVERGQGKLPREVFYTTTGTPPLGIVVEHEGLPTAAAWLYKDTAGVLCWMAWTVTRPCISPFLAARAIDTAEDFLETIAREEGYSLLVGMFKQDSLVKHFERRLGFTRCDTDKGHFMTTKDLTCPQQS